MARSLTRRSGQPRLGQFPRQRGGALADGRATTCRPTRSPTAPPPPRPPAAGRRPCEYCGRLIPRRARHTARLCSDVHRSANAKDARRRETAELGPVRTLRGETPRLVPMVAALAEHAGTLKELLDGAVADAHADAETAHAETQAARRATLAETRADEARDEARTARGGHDEKVAAARRAAAEADQARKETGRAEQARLTAEDNTATAERREQHAREAYADAKAAHDEVTGRLTDAEQQNAVLREALQGRGHDTP
ncbi:hypothetical protein GCM10009527_034300 [Actinomadura nitritigenes]